MVVVLAAVFDVSVRGFASGLVTAGFFSSQLSPGVIVIVAVEDLHPPSLLPSFLDSEAVAGLHSGTRPPTSKFSRARVKPLSRRSWSVQPFSSGLEISFVILSMRALVRLLVSFTRLFSCDSIWLPDGALQVEHDYVTGADELPVPDFGV